MQRQQRVSKRVAPKATTKVKHAVSKKKNVRKTTKRSFSTRKMTSMNNTPKQTSMQVFTTMTVNSTKLSSSPSTPMISLNISQQRQISTIPKQKMKFNLTSVKATPTFDIQPTTVKKHMTTSGIASVFDYFQQQRAFSTADHSEDDHDHGAYERQEAKNPEDVVNLNIIDRQQNKHTIKCKVGDNLLELMRLHTEKTNSEIWLEGSCEKSLACSTCHVILDEKTYNLLQDIKEATEEEEDMLDMAACLTPTSRLGCQINLVKAMDGATITLPKFSRNMYVDGHVPQPH